MLFEVKVAGLSLKIFLKEIKARVGRLTIVFGCLIDGIKSEIFSEEDEEQRLTSGTCFRKSKRLDLVCEFFRRK